jgi:maleylacetate reductase
MPDRPIVFEHVTRGQRVLFGAGQAARHLAAEIDRLGAQAPMVIGSQRHRTLAESAGLGAAIGYQHVVEHVPREVADDARQVAIEHNADLLVAIGGGSATGLAKAIRRTPVQRRPMSGG